MKNKEAVCLKCNKPFEASKFSSGSVKYCPSCRRIIKREKIKCRNKLKRWVLNMRNFGRFVSGRKFTIAKNKMAEMTINEKYQFLQKNYSDWYANRKQAVDSNNIQYGLS